jgi:CubicO group peptidase (beta-lactamase class C family)
MKAELSQKVVPERLEALRTRARREIDEGLLPSAQIALAADGELVCFETYGEATDATRYPIFSATKAFVAAAFWQLLGERKVGVADRVVDHLDGFADGGKDAVTVEHVLLHTAGFPFAPLGPPQWDSHEGRLDAYRAWRLDWDPGAAYMYHATSAHWVLADIIVATTGTDHRDFVRERIVEPLGLSSFGLGIPVAEQEGLAEAAHVGEPMTPDELEAAFGIREIPAPTGSLASMPDFALFLNQPEVREIGIPGGGGFSTAADVAMFYQALLRNEGGLWDPQVLTDGTAVVRNRLVDPMTQAPANRALGTVIAGDDGKAHMLGFGKTESPRAFGHNGAGGQIAWADPATGVSFCYLTNGHDQHMLRGARRTVGISSRAGLVCTPAD